MLCFIASMTVMAQAKDPKVHKGKETVIPKQDSVVRFALVGELNQFNLVYRAIRFPRDVTPNQLDSAVNFIQSLQEIKIPIKK